MGILSEENSQKLGRDILLERSTAVLNEEEHSREVI